MNWIVLFLLLSSSFAFAVEDQTKVRLLQLIKAYTELEEKRIDLLKKQKIVSTEAQQKSAAYAKKKVESDGEEHVQRIGKLKNLAQLIEASSDSKLIRKSIESTLDCDLEECLSILGPENSKLAAQVSDITSRIFIKSWNQFEIHTHSGDPTIDDKSLNASVDLAIRTWTCNRGIGNWKGSISLDDRKMSSCMFNVFKKKFPKASISLSGSKDHSAHRIANNFLNLSTKAPEILEKISQRVLVSRDYQVKPWELFKICTEFSGGDLRNAIDLCYQVVRYNRQRQIFTRKLMDIRGDRPAGGDNSGDWYHFFGMMYKGLTMGAVTPIAYKVYSLLPVVDEIEEKSDRAGMNVGLDMRAFVKSNQSPSGFCSVEDIFKYD